MRVIGIRFELNDKYISVIGEYVEFKKFKKNQTSKSLLKKLKHLIILSFNEFTRKTKR